MGLKVVGSSPFLSPDEFSATVTICCTVLFIIWIYIKKESHSNRHNNVVTLQNNYVTSFGSVMHHQG